MLFDTKKDSSTQGRRVLLLCVYEKIFLNGINIIDAENIS